MCQSKQTTQQDSSVNQRKHTRCQGDMLMCISFCKIRCLGGVKIIKLIRIMEFLCICSSFSLHPLRQVSTPEFTEKASVGGGVTQMFTHGVGSPNPPLQPQATYPRPSRTLWRCTQTTWLMITQSYDTHTQGTPESESVCVWGANSLWLKVTRHREAYPDLV